MVITKAIKVIALLFFFNFILVQKLIFTIIPPYLNIFFPTLKNVYTLYIYLDMKSTKIIL